MKNISRELKALMSRLGDEHQQAATDYATFLVQQYNFQTPVEGGLEPEAIVRLERETVIAAIKRLKNTYYMLDSDEQLDGTSSLMGQHILRGREAPTVIKELQSMFQEKHEKYLEQ
jgi:hypothetical protein